MIQLAGCDQSGGRQARRFERGDAGQFAPSVMAAVPGDEQFDENPAIIKLAFPGNPLTGEHP
jgi:hypothetical protein